MYKTLIASTLHSQQNKILFVTEKVSIQFRFSFITNVIFFELNKQNISYYMWFLDKICLDSICAMFFVVCMMLIVIF